MSEIKSIIDTINQSKKLLQPNQKCIINTDIDGLLSALVLQHFLNWKIVGFCDSKDTIWIDPNERNTNNEIVFVDIFVGNPNYKCIDQHIVAKNKNHVKKLTQNSNKQNPNFNRTRYASSNKKDPNAYAWKYPFGTVHYLIACLEGLGYKISIENTKFENYNTFDLILRADDTARSTADKYRDNALDWWKWLIELGDNQTSQLAEYCIKLDSNYANKSHSKLENIFKLKHECSSSDGNFSKQLKRSKGKITPKLTQYFEDVSSSIQLPTLKINDEYKTLKGTFLTESTKNTKKIDTILNNDNLFSYAYTYCMGPLSKKGFSYTMGPLKWEK
ncbi:hypothetical protein [Urechidicola croceus]|uniref:Uncharacterized protein n=1 Tax=Urechidicola croceus TaxID=1850246 RepID=A0A1D8P7W4_9FLAO|nr:hypothetical protein [Urechidicola croceus]AOW20650.1 hypothetical protein LPB138_08160 [Urechidicola croceus]